MAGGNFLGRVISYVVNELVVEGLANKVRLGRLILFQEVVVKLLPKEEAFQELLESCR